MNCPFGQGFPEADKKLTELGISVGTFLQFWVE